MTRRKKFNVVGLFPRNDGCTVGVVAWQGYFWGLTYNAGSIVTAADVASDFQRLGTSKLFYGFAPVDERGVYNSQWSDESFRKEDYTRC